MMMKRIMDVPIKEGGAAVAGTICQVVAAPADRTVWIAGPDGMDGSPLGPIFGK